MNKTTLATFTLLTTILPAVIITGITPAAFAAEPNKNFFNGHYYQYFADADITWEEAKTAAESKMFNGINGHLATITNSREGFSVGDAIIPANASAWIGLSDKDTEGTYKWVTGELFDYTNWNTAQPSAGTDEDYVEIAPLGNHVYKWNDAVNNSTDIDGYVVEYLPPNAEPVLNPENGHYYQYIHTNTISWTEAKAAAESQTFNGIQGHLVTITSQSEDDFVFNFMPNTIITWIGLSDEDTEGQYKWVTGEPFDYSDWGTSAPYAGASRDYVSIEKHASTTWVNNENNVRLASAYIVEYDTLLRNTDNGHYYEYVADDDITWTAAKAAAENSTYNGASGHLVTITTASENTFVADLVPDDSHSWIGLSDETTEGTYQWVTGKPFDYTNWNTAQPSAGTDEDYVEFLGSNGKWDDTTNNNTGITGYVVEYTTPDSVPKQNPENGHYYQYINDHGITWTDAKTAAESKVFNDVNGHLVTITTANENDFVAGLVTDDSHSWIALTDKDTEGQYKWVTGERYFWTNWNTAQPSAGGNEHYVEFLGSNNKWNDTTNNNTGITGYIIEYDFPVQNPGNNNYYQFITANGITWTEAKNAAEKSRLYGMHGYLATISTASENEFIDNLVPEHSYSWIGLTDKVTEGDFKWAAGDPNKSYRNWDSNQPSAGTDEDYVQFVAENGKWNDVSNNIDSSADNYITGYVVEYDDIKPALNPENGHYYIYWDRPYPYPYDYPWSETLGHGSIYKGIGGHRATITSQSENDFVAGVVPDDARAWIGLSDEDKEGEYKWVTANLLIDSTWSGTESFDYSNWDVNQPDNAGGNEHYVEFLGSNNKWNDVPKNYPLITGSVIEYTPNNPLKNPENGHFYKYRFHPGLSWTDAKNVVESNTFNGLAGDLATITSQSENDFVSKLVAAGSRPWIGLSNTDYPQVHEWQPGVEFFYSNWIFDTNPSSDYVAEYPPLDTDPVKNSENGHYYQYITDPIISWTAAKTAAENSTLNGIAGHLVTITSASENEFVDNLVGDHDFRLWMGLTDEDIEGDYTWITDESLAYTNWDIYAPNPYLPGVDYAEFLSSSGKWYANSHNSFTNSGYIIEYEITANAPVKNTANGYYYKLVIDPFITWTDAKEAAENSMFNGVNGKLVTITSASENTFVDNLVGDHDFKLWMGLSYAPSEENYTWVNGETFSYTNWNTGEPSTGTSEYYVEFSSSNGKWNTTVNNNTGITGYIIEYTPESPPVRNPDNGHYYEYIATDPSISWTDAKAAAESKTFEFEGVNGHLVTITSQSENDFVAELVGNGRFIVPWIGLTDETTEGTYEWVTGESYNYTNWAPGQPDDSNNSDYVGFHGISNEWFDRSSFYVYSFGYIVEYDTPDT